MNAAWAASVAPLAGYAAAWGRPILFGETGERSIVGAGYIPFQGRPGTAQVPATDQDAFVQGLFASVWRQDGFAGFMWWIWFGPPGSDEPVAFSPKAPAQATFTANLS